jgi:hypothetical protein
MPPCICCLLLLLAPPPLNPAIPWTCRYRYKLQNLVGSRCLRWDMVQESRPWSCLAQPSKALAVSLTACDGMLCAHAMATSP